MSRLIADDLPLPPLEMRELVGLTDPAGYENPTGEPIFGTLSDHIRPASYRSYLDFGCGCGRSARRLLQQRDRPERYVGVDLHRGLIEWCRRNLAPADPNFSFAHHDVFNPGLNPDPRAPRVAPLPVEDGSVTLIEATSVFTHLTEGQAEHYLDEVARVLTGEGVLVATFFLFDKAEFPFMQDFQNALYVNELDPTNAVVYDRGWLREATRERGLAVVDVKPPTVRGYHTWVVVTPQRAGVAEAPFPVDDAPVARRPPPLLREGAEHVGLDGGPVADGQPAVRRRAEIPPADPTAIELANAKEYIASLEEHLEAVRAEAAALRTAAAPPS